MSDEQNAINELQEPINSSDSESILGHLKKLIAESEERAAQYLQGTNSLAAQHNVMQGRYEEAVSTLDLLKKSIKDGIILTKDIIDIKKSI